MTRLTNILKRALISPSASPAKATGNSATLVRSEAVRNLNMNLPAPIGKRDQIKRSLGAVFAASPAVVALDGPVKRQARLNAAKTPVLQDVATLKQEAAFAAARAQAKFLTRFDAVPGVQVPRETRKSVPPDPKREYPPNPMLSKKLPTIHEREDEG